MTNIELRKVRCSWGLSQSNMAKTIKVPFRTYQNWEYGIRPVPEWVPYMLSLIQELVMKKRAAA